MTLTNEEKNTIANDLLANTYKELTIKEHYDMVFDKDYLQSNENERDGKGKILLYNTIKDDVTHKYLIDANLDIEGFLNLRENGLDTISLGSYFGTKRDCDHLNTLFGFGIDLDGCQTKKQLLALFRGIENWDIPTPTIITNSGRGLHLYYIFKDPIVIEKNRKKIEYLNLIKHALEYKVWKNEFTDVTDVSQQSIVQGYRTVGSKTKLDNGSVVRSFLVGEKISFMKLLSMLDTVDLKENRKPGFITTDEWETAYKMFVEENDNKIPDSGEVKKTSKKSVFLACPIKVRNLVKKLKNNAVHGKRENTAFCLTVIALQNKISKEQCEAFLNEELLVAFKALDTDYKTRYTVEENERVLKQVYDNKDKYMNFKLSRTGLSTLTGISFEAPKVNGRTKKEHVEYLKREHLITGRPMKTIESFLSTDLGRELYADLKANKILSPNYYLERYTDTGRTYFFKWKKRLLEFMTQENTIKTTEIEVKEDVTPNEDMPKIEEVNVENDQNNNTEKGENMKKKRIDTRPRMTKNGKPIYYFDNMTREEAEEELLNDMKRLADLSLIDKHLLLPYHDDIILVYKGEKPPKDG